MISSPDLQMNSLPKNLHQLVGIVAGNSMPTAVQKNSFIVNEIPREYQIVTDETLLAILLNTLLGLIVNNSRDSCIRIKATEYDDMIFVSIRDNCTDAKYEVTGSLEQAKLLAKKMNGSVTVESTADKFTTVSLSFPNFPKAA